VLVFRALTTETESLIGDGPIRLLAAGKASRAMTTAFLSARPRDLVAGCVVGLGGAGRWPDRVSWREGGHPVPTKASVDAGVAALELAAAAAPPGTLVVLLSGGASAMLALPVEGLTLADKQATTRRLLLEGADIHAVNAVRKHLSRIKGGRLGAASGGPVVTLVISDVVGDDLSVIGSGPTFADRSTFQDAIDVLDRFGGRSAYPAPAVEVLQRGAAGEIPDTPKPGDQALAHSTIRLIGSTRSATDGAGAEARSRGYRVHLRPDPVIGEARDAAGVHARLVAEIAASSTRPFCVVSGGETTVRVAGSGIGGRSQEFALALAGTLAEMGLKATAISIGTDGLDGPTDAAGAIIDESTVARARAAGLGDPGAYLTNNDSYRFFSALGDLVITGPTGTNVGDLQVVLVA
jgi:glycerate 2-kinase